MAYIQVKGLNNDLDLLELCLGPPVPDTETLVLAAGVYIAIGRSQAQHRPGVLLVASHLRDRQSEIEQSHILIVAARHKGVLLRHIKAEDRRLMAVRDVSYAL